MSNHNTNANSFTAKLTNTGWAIVWYLYQVRNITQVSIPAFWTETLSLWFLNAFFGSFDFLCVINGVDFSASRSGHTRVNVTETIILSNFEYILSALTLNALTRFWNYSNDRRYTLAVSCLYSLDNKQHGCISFMHVLSHFCLVSAVLKCCAWHSLTVLKQESLADAKATARQQWVYDGP